MNDQPFLDAIRANPSDDTPRRVYADYLVETGRPERAEFIQVQCEIARLKAEQTERFNDGIDWKQCTVCSARWCPNCGDCTCKTPEDRLDDADCPLHAPTSKHAWVDDFERKSKRLGERIDAVLRQDIQSIVDDLIPGWHAFVRDRKPGMPMRVFFTQDDKTTGDFRFTWARGFIDTVECQWQNCSDHFDAIFAAHPVREVVLTSLPDWPVDVELNSPVNSSPHPLMRFKGRKQWVPVTAGFPSGRWVWTRTLCRVEWPQIKEWNTSHDDVPLRGPMSPQPDHLWGIQFAFYVEPGYQPSLETVNDVHGQLHKHLRNGRRTNELRIYRDQATGRLIVGGPDYVWWDQGRLREILSRFMSQFSLPAYEAETDRLVLDMAYVEAVNQLAYHLHGTVEQVEMSNQHNATMHFVVNEMVRHLAMRRRYTAAPRLPR